jgi:hypothetical protein
MRMPLATLGADTACPTFDELTNFSVARDRKGHCFLATNKSASTKSKLFGDLVMSSEANYAFKVTV